MQPNYGDPGDRVLDWLYSSAPNLLHDDLLVEGFLRLVMKEIRQAVRDEQRRRVEVLTQVQHFGGKIRW